MSRNDPRILFAEDNPELAELIMMFFRSAPFRYDLANTGQEVTGLHHMAIEAGDPYDLMILDVAMPMKLGTTALREIREEGDWETPAIVVTGLPKEDTEKEIRGLNVKRVLYKPVDYDELRGCILETLEETHERPGH